MKTGKLFSKWIAALCAILLMISLFAVPAFADTAASGGTVEGENNGSDAETNEDEDTNAGEDADIDEGEDTDEDETESGGDTVAVTEKKGLTTAQIVWIVIGGIVLVVAVVLCIKFRAKIVKGLRVYKSEFKKVSWLSWEQTKKSTLVVLVVLVACAAIICLMDFGLSKAIRWLILEAFQAPTGK